MDTRGLVSIGVSNLFDESFDFADTDPINPRIEFEADPTGKTVGIEKIGGGDAGKAPAVPAAPHSDNIVMAVTRHSPGHICFWFQGQWVCFQDRANPIVAIILL